MNNLANRIETAWPFLVLFLLLLVFTASLVLPSALLALIWVLAAVSVVSTLLFTFRRHLKLQSQGRITRRQLILRFAIDTAGILLAIGASILIAGAVGQRLASAVGGAVEPAWPGKGATAGLLAGMIAGVGIGFLAGWLVRGVWGRLVRY